MIVNLTGTTEADRIIYPRSNSMRYPEVIRRSGSIDEIASGNKGRIRRHDLKGVKLQYVVEDGIAPLEGVKVPNLI